MPLHDHAKNPEERDAPEYMPPIGAVRAAAGLRKAALQRKRNRRAAHEEEERHDDVPRGEPLPRMCELEQESLRELPSGVDRPDERLHGRLERLVRADGEEHHVESPQEVERIKAV